jgi:hypothetical protein
MQKAGNEPRISDLDDYIARGPLSQGQRSRLRTFQSVETGICQRVEELCQRSGIEVTDVGVLVIAPGAQPLFFGEDAEPGTNVVLGHRARLYAFLNAILPPTADAPFDPYVDLLAPSPDRCVRVLIIDDESLTVMSYGTFVTVRIDPANKAVA